MNNKTEYDTYRTCSNMLNEGKVLEAVRLAESITYAPFRAAIYIDGGFYLANSRMVRTGTKIFEDSLLDKKAQSSNSKCMTLYNLANGYSALYSLKHRKSPNLIPPNDSDLRRAKNLYRQAIEILNTVNESFASQVYVNYGNCLSQQGRFIDAIECYEHAIQVDPTNSMAAGNLGIELDRASRITGKYRHEYVGLAYAYLQQSLSPKMNLSYSSPKAIESFKLHLIELENLIKAHASPILPPEPTKSLHENFRQAKYIQFCIENGLFLNAWAGDSHLSPGITDDISYGEISTPDDDDYLVPELIRILNEIKESFTTARYLFFLSQNQNEVLNNVSKTTLYFDHLEYPINGIYTGLCKTAYSRAFDVLDKVARIINTYFGIGKRESTFWSTFAVKQSLGEEHNVRFIARGNICEARNPSLYALADLCIDYFEDAKVDLKTIDSRRNRITHDYLNVKLLVEKDECKENVIRLDELNKQTKDVLRLAKYAVLYAVSSINIAERKKDKPKNRAIPIFYDSKQGNTFLK